MRISALPMIMIFVVGSAAVLSCRTLRSDSRVLHDESFLNTKRSSWMWRSHNQIPGFIKVVSDSVGLDGLIPRKVESPNVLQNFLNELHRRLMQKNPELAAEVPGPPQLYVVDSSRHIASNVGYFTCYEPQDISALGTRERPQASFATAHAVDISINQDHVVSLMPDVDATEIVPVTVARFDEMLNWVNASVEDCEFQRLADKTDIDLIGVKAMNSKCRVSPFAANITYARSLCIPQTTDLIVLSAELLRNAGSIERVFAVLSHEAGHYYAGHSSIQKRRFGYAYFEDQYGRKNFPQPADASIQEKVSYISERMLQLSRFQFPQSPISTDTLSAVFQFCLLARKLNDKSIMSPRCESTFHKGIGMKIHEFLTGLTGRSVLIDMKQFDAFIARIQQCAKETKVDAELLNLLETAILPQKAEFESFSDSILAKSTSDNILLSSVIEEIQLRFERFRSFSKQQLQAIQMQPVGIYTIEQHADDMAAEFMAMMGFDPQVVVERMLSLETLSPKLTSVDEYVSDARVKDCAQRIGSEKVTVEDLADEHHDFCYRAYNLKREIEDHRYEISADRFQSGYETDYQAFLSSFDD